MKHFNRIEPTTEIEVGTRFKKKAVIKNYHTEDGLVHEFTTFCKEGLIGGAVIALTTDMRVVTTYQFRPGPERWMYELPGGGFEEGEDPETGVMRELAEETGYTPGSVEFLGTSYGDAYTNFQRHYFLATDCTPGDRKLDQHEIDQGAEVRLISIAELIDNAKNDNMTDPVAVLQAYEKLKAMVG